MQTKQQLFKIEGFKGENPKENKVFVNGIQLENDPEGFTWDYHGGGPNRLSAAILSKFIPVNNRTVKEGRKKGIMSDEFDELTKKFTAQKIRGWGYGDFMIHMDMKHWLRFHGNYKGPIIFQHLIAEEGKE